MSTGRYAGPHSQHSGCNCAINLSASSCPVHRVSYPVGFHAPTLSKIIVESQSTITCVHSSGKRVLVNLDKKQSTAYREHFAFSEANQRMRDRALREHKEDEARRKKLIGGGPSLTRVAGGKRKRESTSLTNDELRCKCRDRGLKTTGNKQKLEERLSEYGFFSPRAPAARPPTNPQPPMPRRGLSMFSVGSDDSDVCEVTEVRPPALTRARSNSFSFGSDDSVCVVKEVIRRPARTSSNSKPASTVAVGDPTVPQHRRVSFAVFYPPELRIRPTLQYFDSLSSVQSLLESAVKREECDALKPASCKLISGNPRKLNLFNERGDLVLDSMLLDAHVPNTLRPFSAVTIARGNTIDMSIIRANTAELNAAAAGATTTTASRPSPPALPQANAPARNAAEAALMRLAKQPQPINKGKAPVRGPQQFTGRPDLSDAWTRFD